MQLRHKYQRIEKGIPLSGVLTEWSGVDCKYCLFSCTNDNNNNDNNNNDNNNNDNNNNDNDDNGDDNYS